MARINHHGITLASELMVLRPLTEDDWLLVQKWWNNPDIRYYSDDNDDLAEYTLDHVRDILRSISQRAFCFVIEYARRPVGECWLQEMNLDRVLEQYPGKDIRRIDITIGETEFWGRGIGSEAIRLLVEFGFRKQKADAIFAEVFDYNVRSLGAFKNAGFKIRDETTESPGSKAKVSYDLMLMRSEYNPPRERKGAAK